MKKIILIQERKLSFPDSPKPRTTLMILMILLVALLIPGVLGLGLSVNSPTRMTYNKAAIAFDLNASAKSDFYYSVLNTNFSSGNFVKLCSNAQTCVRQKIMSEGVNTILFKAISGSNSVTKTVSFMIDSKKPRIMKTFPSGGSVINGSLFWISYSEENLKNITLFYQTDGINGNRSGNCTSGLGQVCYFPNMDLSLFDGKMMDFWFNLTDGVNSVISQKTRVKVDLDAPSMSITGPTLQDNGRVKFIFDITDANFKDVSYIDSNDCDVNFNMPGIFCSSLQGGRCISIKKFCAGTHNWTIVAKDKAGNSVTDYRYLDLTI